MKINKKTFLYEDFSQKEAMEMLRFVRALEDGILSQPFPDFVEFWFQEFSYKEDQKYLALASYLPQQILASIIQNSAES